jgi:tetratricopeptide (TPR) repeat protein
VVLDAARPSAALAGRLTRATRSGLKVEVEGAGWVWPSVLDGVQPGDETLIYADVPADKPFRIKVAGQALPLAGTLSNVERPLLERAWVRARIARLMEMRDAPEKVAGLDRDMAEALKKQAIDLSVKYRVLCPFTSLLVLETEQDYARFGIERRALADILTVGTGGIALLHRSDLGALTGQPLEVGAPVDGALPANARPAAADAQNSLKEKKGAAMSDAAPARRFAAAKASARPAMEAEAPREERKRDVAAAAIDDLLGGGSMAPSQVRGMAEPMAVAPAAPPPPRAMAPAPALSRPMAARPRSQGVFAPTPVPAPVASTPPVAGPFKDVLDLLRRGNARGALSKALAWRADDAGDVLALVALGECWEALGDATQASRAYGSLIDLFPGRADMRRFAGERLERVRSAAALALAVDTYRKAVEQRPDHPASHRLLGFALLKQGHPRAAFEVIAAGAARSYPAGRFRGVERILAEDLGLTAAAWMRVDPAHADDIRARLTRAGGTVEAAPSLRFVLNWETDANDVDFHIHDGHGGHALYSSPRLPSGGELYADVTTGYGPECFTIRNAPQARAFPYRLQAHYYSRGPMGYGMGKLQIIEHDGKGGLRFEERPFVIMEDGAFVDLGTVTGTMQVSPAVVAR